MLCKQKSHAKTIINYKLQVTFSPCMICTVKKIIAYKCFLYHLCDDLYSVVAVLFVILSAVFAVRLSLHVHSASN